MRIPFLRRALMLQIGVAVLASSRIAMAQPAAPAAAAAAPAPVVAPVVAAAPANGRLETLEVRVSKPFFQGGEPVWLDLTLVNRSNRPAAFLMLGPKLEFKLKRDGKQVGLTYLAKDQSKGDKISTRTVPVGEKFSYRVTLNRVFDLSRAGTYTLSCTKYLRNEALGPDADLVGPQIVGQTIKFAVSEEDLAPPIEAPQAVETAKPTP